MFLGIILKFNSRIMTNVPFHRRPFYNKYPDHDFGLIYDILKEFYPVGSAKRYTSKNIGSSAGFKKIGAVVEENFINKKNHRDRWVKLNHFIKKEMKKPVHSAVSLFNCCYSGEVVLEQIRKEDFVKSKKLHFYISLLGPFFAIHGIDSSTVILPVDALRGESYQGNFAATHAITVSSVFEYASTFLLLEDTLREFFSGYYFIPFDIGMSTIKNISIQDDLRDPRMIDTVYEDFLVRMLSIIASREGMSDTVLPIGLNRKRKRGKLNDEVSRHIINSPNKTTLHKAGN